jgi:rhodanese-related sulfurtransferase
MNHEQTALNPRQAADLISDPQVLFLDVREDDEHDYCAIAGALHIPMNQIGERLSCLPQDKRIIVFCHHGMRSMHVAQFLRNKGFLNVQNLSGGIDAWSLEVDPSVPRY